MAFVDFKSVVKTLKKNETFEEATWLCQRFLFPARHVYNFGSNYVTNEPLQPLRTLVFFVVPDETASQSKRLRVIKSDR